MTDLYEKCFDIINSTNLKSKQSLEDFFVSFLEIVKNKYNLSDINIEIKSNSRFVEFKNNTFVIDKDLITKRNVYEVLTNICYHLEKQKTLQHNENKQLTKSKHLSIPIEKITRDIDCLQKYIPFNISCLTYTSKLEKTCRDNANNFVDSFFSKIQNYNNLTTKSKKYIFVQSEKIKTKIAREKYIYFNKVSDLPMYKDTYTRCFEALIDEQLKVLRNAKIIMDCNFCTPKEIAEAEKDMQNFVDVIDSVMQVYCDDLQKDQIIYTCYNANLIKPIYSVFNSEYSNITKQNFNDLFKVALHNNISIEEIQKNLTKWDTDLVKDLHDKFLENEKNNEISADLF